MVDQTLTQFKLNAFYPHVPTLGSSVETSGKLDTIFHWMDATVPGTVYNDLLRAGIIRDPYVEMQSLECEWVPQRWWSYKTDFFISEQMIGRHLRLRLKGVDYTAHIKINDKHVGSHTGMYTPFVTNVNQTVHRGENSLEVILENAPDEMGQIGYTERTHTQKARFAYKWDWCPRMIHLGLYDDVVIEHFGAAAIEYANIDPVFRDGKWQVDCKFDITGFCKGDVTLALKFGDRVMETTHFINEGSGTISTSFDAGDVELWWPNGHGAQSLYDLSVSILDGDGLSDTKDFKIGFRTIEYACCEYAEDGSLPYNVIINGKKIYIKGVNFAPIDMMYGSVSDDRYETLLTQAAQANINLLRVWGGGLIEKEVFYNLCDRLGIMVWQEFIQSSSGINNVPSKNQEFLRLAAATAEEATKTRRNHVSLSFWSGGNELTDENGVPATFKDENLYMLEKIARKNDPGILMLPTSASGPQEFLDTSAPRKNHDVHGPWKYLGTMWQYKIFNDSDSQLHSEFGADGYTNLNCLKSFLNEENVVCQIMKENIVLRHHGEWWDTYERDSAIFGNFRKDELETFIACSQFIQADGIRYALEANRRRAFENCGSIIWQLNEPWPNASGTNVVDYNFNPKLAYFFLRDAYRPVNTSLKYSKLTYAPEEEATAEIFVSNDGSAFMDDVTVTVTDANDNTLFNRTYSCAVSENSSVSVSVFTFKMPKEGGVTVLLSLGSRQVVSKYLLLVTDNEGYAMRETTVKFVNAYLRDTEKL